MLVDDQSAVADRLPPPGHAPHPAPTPEHASDRPSRAERPIRLSIISPSQLLRDGLVALLAGHLALSLVGSYPLDPCASGGLPNPADHVVLLDGSAGVEPLLLWTRYWRAQPAPPGVVVIELPAQTEPILACIEAGASGYVLRGEPTECVATTIRAAHSGAAYCSPAATAQLFASLTAQRPAATSSAAPPLTTRELEVLRLIVGGSSNQQIAAALVIEVRTVKHHVHNILEKLKLRHRWEAARLASEQGWFSEPPKPS